VTSYLTVIVDRRLDFIVEVKKAIDLPKEMSRDVYCEYSFEDEVF